ncbi:MAG: hypothetical protein AABM64_03710 [Pseudomonadota bacterium]
MPLTDKSGKPINPVSYHPNQNLALAIVRAWRESKYRDRLLTYSSLTTQAQWAAKSAPNFSRTKDALKEVGIFLDEPVVLTPSQFAWGYQKVADEVVFVLPDPLTEDGFTMPSAEIAMVVTPLGM